MAQDQTRAARMVAQGCTKIPTMKASTRSHQEPMAHRPTGAPIAPWPRGKILTAKAGRRHAAFRSASRGMRQSSTPSHSTTPHRQASPSATGPEEAPIPQIATGSILEEARGGDQIRNTFVATTENPGMSAVDYEVKLLALYTYSPPLPSWATGQT